MTWLFGSGAFAALAAALLAVNWSWRIAWRAIIVYAVMLGAGVLLLGPVRSPSHDPLGQMADSIVMLGLTLPFLAFGLRVLCRPFVGDPPDAGQPFDPILWAFLGAAGALQAFTLASLLFAGFDRPVLAHVLVVLPPVLLLGIAMSLPVIALRYAAAAGALTVALSSLLSAFWFPAFVTTQAARFADGAPFCLMLQDRKREPERRLDLSFLTLDKNEVLPHLTVNVRYQRDVLRGYWSYHERRFEPLNYSIAAVPCAP